jgi:cation transport ATPase
MEIASRLGGLGNVITAGLNLYQTAEYSKRSQAAEQTRHENELELMRQQHRRELITAKQTYLISTFTDIEQYCQELNENLVNSTKDAERDMVDQRSQQFQTILLAGTIMITSVINILIQGPLPESADGFSKIAYSITNTGAVFFIGLNMLLCIQLIYRVTQFMYRRSESNLSQLREAMSETRKMMGKIRGDDDLAEESQSIGPGTTFDIPTLVPQFAETEGNGEEMKEPDGGDTSADRKGPHLVHSNSFPTLAASRSKSAPALREPSHRSHISRLTLEEVDVQWRQHESEVHAYLHRRSAINERRELLRFGAVSFEHFWNTSCRDTGFLALVSFYIGTSLMLLATMVFFWNKYLHVYHEKAGAMSAVVTIGVSLFVCLGFAVYLRFFDPSINHMRDDTTTLASPDSNRDIKYD